MCPEVAIWLSHQMPGDKKTAKPAKAKETAGKEAAAKQASLPNMRKFFLAMVQPSQSIWMPDCRMQSTVVS